MSTLTEAKLRSLLCPYLEAPVAFNGQGAPSETGAAIVEERLPDNLYTALSLYLDLLVRWNAKTNLTAIREPELIVTRHFGESLYTARVVQALRMGRYILDYGSGAGLPGIPIQLYLPDRLVVLGESQGKKASFLRNVVRELGLPAQVWSERVEIMPKEQLFDVVVMRAVDDPQRALSEAWGRVRDGGWLVQMTTLKEGALLSSATTGLAIPGTLSGWVKVAQRVAAA